MIFFLNHGITARLKKSEGQTIREKNGKSNLFYDFNNLGWATETGNGGAVWFIL